MRGAFTDLITVSTQRPNTTDARELLPDARVSDVLAEVQLQCEWDVAGRWGWGNRRCALGVAVEGSISGPGLGEVCPFGVYLAFNQLGSEVGLGPRVEYRGV